MSILKLLASNSFLTVNKELCKLLTLEAAVIFADLAGAQQYNKNKWFFRTREKIEEETTIKRQRQIKAIKLLEDKGLIKSMMKGIPAKKHYIIDAECINNLLELINETTSRPKSVQQDVSNQDDYYNNNTDNNTKCVHTENDLDKRPTKSLPFDIVTAKDTIDALYSDWKDLAKDVKEIKGYEVTESVAKKCLRTFISDGVARYYTSVRSLSKLQSLLIEWVVKEIHYSRNNQPAKDIEFSEYLTEVVEEKELRELNHLKKLEKLKELREKEDFKLQNLAKGYENPNITSNLVFEVCYMKLGNAFTAQSARRKLEQFQKWLKNLSDYDLKRGDIRELLKSKKKC